MSWKSSDGAKSGRKVLKEGGEIAQIFIDTIKSQLFHAALIVYLTLGIGIGLASQPLLAYYAQATGVGASVIQYIVRVIHVVMLSLTGPLVASLVGLRFATSGMNGRKQDYLPAAFTGLCGHIVLLLTGTLTVDLLLAGQAISISSLIIPVITGGLGAVLAAAGGVAGGHHGIVTD